MVLGEFILGSSPPPAPPAALDGPDIVSADGPVPDARLLFRAPGGDEVSCLTEESAVAGCEGEVPVGRSGSVRSARFDIGDEDASGEKVFDIEDREIEKAGERSSCCVREWLQTCRFACGLVEDRRV